MKKILILILILFTTLSFAAEKPLTKVTVVLDWFINPDHAPLFVAKQQGYFKQQGLDVTFINPADPADPPKYVAAGRADIAITYQPRLMLDIAESLPLVRIGTLIATPLNCLVVLKSSPIKSIPDLKGKSIGYSTSGVDDVMLKAMLSKYGMTEKDVKLINVHYDLTQALLTNRIDAATGMMRNFELIQMRLAGKPGRAFYPEEYGMPPYDELILITHKNNLKNPILPKFLKALTEGVQYLVNHPKQTWKVFAKNHPELNNSLNKQAWFATIPRFALRPAALDKSRYLNFAAFLKKQGVLKSIPPLNTYAVALLY